MTDQNSYDTLGLDESSSFEQIQEARERLLQECNDDRKRADAIEAAYDAILMERLRLRQEGKIKVPDRIRFAEQAADKPAKKASSEEALSSPSWLAGWLDTPSRDDIFLPAAVFGGLGLAATVFGPGGIISPSFLLATGVGCSIYFLNRKEYRFWRAMLITVLGLAVGLALGFTLGQAIASQGTATAMNVPAEGLTQAIAAIITLIVLWVVSSFLR